MVLWRQEDTSSLRLFSVDSSGRQMIRNFSLRQRLHLLLVFPSLSSSLKSVFKLLTRTKLDSNDCSNRLTNRTFQREKNLFELYFDVSCLIKTCFETLASVCKRLRCKKNGNLRSLQKLTQPGLGFRAGWRARANQIA